MTSEIHLKVLREIEKTPSISQRELAKKLGVSLGKTNYCLKALLGKGLVRAKNFKTVMSSTDIRKHRTTDESLAYGILQKIY